MRSIFLPNRFFYAAGLLLTAFVAAFAVRAMAQGPLPGLEFMVPLAFPAAKTALVVFGALVLVDVLLVFGPATRIACERHLPKQFSLGDENQVTIELTNTGVLPVSTEVVDEIPDQFQKRDFSIQQYLSKGERVNLVYQLRPTARGEYHFYFVNVFVRSFLGLVERRIRFDHQTTVPVYPSVVQMKHFELKAFTRISTLQGIKRLRKIGHSYEFEQIRNYVKGDDLRSVNWKATGRHNSLMVNQYEDERSQQVYSVIDKSRSMKLAFDGMTLMDYAINTSLVISNIVLQRHDKAGLLTFSDKIGSTIVADNSPAQLRRIMEALYREKERRNEANFELLYSATRNFIRRRSLVMLYTNFESYYAMQRVLPLLRRINNLHLLVVVFFENTEISDYTRRDAQNLEGVYFETIARNFIAEKTRIVQELKQYGIQAILTRPEDLSVNTINKYLELKAKGLI